MEFYVSNIFRALSEFPREWSGLGSWGINRSFELEEFNILRKSVRLECLLSVLAWWSLPGRSSLSDMFSCSMCSKISRWSIGDSSSIPESFRMLETLSSLDSMSINFFINQFDIIKFYQYFLPILTYYFPLSSIFITHIQDAQDPFEVSLKIALYGITWSFPIEIYNLFQLFRLSRKKFMRTLLLKLALPRFYCIFEKDINRKRKKR